MQTTSAWGTCRIRSSTVPRIGSAGTPEDARSRKRTWLSPRGLAGPGIARERGDHADAIQKITDWNQVTAAEDHCPPSVLPVLAAGENALFARLAILGARECRPGLDGRALTAPWTGARAAIE
jgi:hypothetical protein